MASRLQAPRLGGPLAKIVSKLFGNIYELMEAKLNYRIRAMCRSIRLADRVIWLISRLHQVSLLIAARAWSGRVNHIFNHRLSRAQVMNKIALHAIAPPENPHWWCIRLRSAGDLFSIFAQFG